MTMNRNVNKFHTTIGELIVALSDAAFEVCAEKRGTLIFLSPWSLSIFLVDHSFICPSSCSAMPKGIRPHHIS